MQRLAAGDRARVDLDAVVFRPDAAREALPEPLLPNGAYFHPQH
jgi:hypothetical protein